jgi:hypothetical protein
MVSDASEAADFAARCGEALLVNVGTLSPGALAGARAAAESTKAEIVEVKKIWEAGGHNAFTDLIRWRERW